MTCPSQHTGSSTILSVSTGLIRASLLSLLIQVCLVSPAVAKLSGYTEFSYADYSLSQDDRSDVNYSAFTQEYSFLFEKQGFILDPRFGQYSLGLGYQWADVQTDGDAEGAPGSSGKILYKGNLSIAPGGLPFRLDAYSYDAAPPRYATFNPERSVLDTGLRFGVDNGQASYSGLSFYAGIRNGNYLGMYRELLSKFPRIFFDYRQTYYRNVDGVYKTHHQTRDLAFVSLNKKDNWFHYRYKEHKDFMDNRLDTNTKSYILGTVDQNLRRQWINLTNWLKLSADGSLTEEKSNDFVSFDANPETYRLNLFSRGNVNKINFSNFSSFERTSHDDGVNQAYDVPFYANGYFDPNRSWSAQMIFYRNDKEGGSPLDPDRNNEEGEYLAGSIKIGVQRAIQYDVKLELESSRQEIGDANAVRGRLEMTSNRTASRRTYFLLGASGTYIDAKANFTEGLPGAPSQLRKSSGSIQELNLYGAAKWRVSSRSDLELKQNFLYGSTGSLQSFTDFILLKGQPGNAQEILADDYMSSETLLALDTRLRPGLDNRLDLVHISVFSEEDNSNETTLRQNLIYSKPTIYYRLQNTISVGDELSAGVTSVDSTVNKGKSNNLDRINDPGNVNVILETESDIRYSPNRNFEVTGGFSLKWFENDLTDVLSQKYWQGSQYTFFSQSGYLRKVSQIYQEFAYEHYSDDFQNKGFYKLLLGASYSPLRFYEFGGEVLYENYFDDDVSALRLSTWANLNFPSLTCELRYSYGMADNFVREDVGSNEHLFETKIKKTF